MSDTLRIAVCVKQVLDPEATPTTLRIDAELPTVSAPGTPPLLNPYDLNALRAALDLRDGTDAEITVLSVAASLSKALMLKTLAAGADRVLALADPTDPARLIDADITVARLAALVHHAGGFDLILTGRRASDTNRGVVGPLLANQLGAACVTLATAVAPGDPGEVLVDRLTGHGTETLACPLPAVVTVSSEAGDLTPTNFRHLAEAKKKPLDVLGPDDLAFRPPPVRQRITSLSIPETGRECRFVEADDDRAAGRALAAVLTESVPV